MKVIPEKRRAHKLISTFLICFITTASHVGKSGTPSDICVVDSAYVRFANVYF